MEDPATIRREVRAHLANRPSVAQSAITIYNAIKDEFDTNEREVSNALIFLKNLSPPQVVETQDPLGSKLYYQITSEGSLAHERS